MGYSRCFALLCAVFATAAALPAHAAETRLAIIPVVSKGTTIKDLNAKLIEQNLDGVTVLPYPAVARSAQKLGFKPAGLRKPGNAAAAGKAAGATHVLIMDSVHVGKKRRAGYSVRVSLVDVSSAKVTYTHQYALNGKKLNANVAAQVGGDLGGKLSGEPTNDADGDGDATADADAPAQRAGNKGGKRMNVAKAEDGDSGRADDGGGGGGGGGSDSSGEDGDTPSASAEVKPEGENSASARPAFQLDAGLMPYVRGAAISSGGTPGPCFCQVPASKSPLLNRADARAEFYPGSIVGSGAWWEGFGVQLNLGIGIPRRDTGNPVTATSNDISGGVGYRLVLGDTLTSPDLKFKLGYDAYTFNVTNLTFPSLGFRSPYFGIAADIPLGTEYVVLVGEVRALAPLSAVVLNNALGAQEGAAFGFHGEAGLRFNLGYFAINTLFLLDNYSASFTGNTNLPNGGAKYTNVSLTDRVIGGLITVGFQI